MVRVEVEGLDCDPSNQAPIELDVSGIGASAPPASD
jgi:hypothetical protein